MLECLSHYPSSILRDVSVCTLIVFLSPLIIFHTRRIGKSYISIVNSIVGGLSLGGILSDMLPDLMVSTVGLCGVESRGIILDERLLFFFVFFWILVGFCITYSLEKLAYQASSLKKDPHPILFHLELGSLCLVMIGTLSTFPALAYEGTKSIVLVTLVMICELFLEENAMIRHFRTRFNTKGRIIVMLCILIGCGFGLIGVGRIPGIFALSFQSAIIGALLLSVVKTEFDLLEGKSHFPTFLISVSIKVMIGIILIIFARL